MLISCTLFQSEIKAQDNFTPENEVTPFIYDEIPVLVMIEGYGNFYLDVIYANDDLLYINIKELFNTLKIPCYVGQKGDSLSGFIENEKQTYLIDFRTGQIKVGDKTINSKSGMVKEMGSVYMESALFAQAFGITLTFNYRSLSVILKSNFELPVIKEKRTEKLRNNMSKVRGGELIADMVIPRNYHIFKPGMLDWALASSQTWKGSSDNRFSLGLGTELFYGEADVSVNYSDKYKFDNRQLNYLWRWVDNDKKIIKQAQVGKISAQSISFLTAPVIGAVIRNSPTTVRKAKGYYTINEFTEPNWTIELYINNVMVDYTKADASGLFTFKVPIVYGYTTLKLIFYGTMGEERTEERTINMPYSVMPSNEFEYGLSLGVLQDSSASRFGKGEFNYGVNRFLTIGGGMEYLSSIPNAAFIPFAKATLQPYSKLTLNGEYAHGVKSRGLANFYFRKDALLEIDYTRFVEGQLATRFNSLEERKVKLSVPFRYKMTTIFAKIDYSQFVYKAFNFNQANIMFSSYYKQASANTSFQLNWIDQNATYITANLALSYRMKSGYTIRPSTQYNVSENKFTTFKIAIEKSISKGYFTVAYERNISYKENLISLNFKYDLSFARASISASYSKDNFTVSENAQGSLAFGSGNQYIHKSNNSSVGKGGISIYPFLDLNQNGIFDKSEHLVKLSSVRINGGKAIKRDKDLIIRIPDLNAFTSYFVEFNDNNLPNIAWRFKDKTYQVLIDPNQFKRIDIPVTTVGEVSGMTYMNKNNTLKGIGRILVKFYYKNNKRFVAETLSESDGYIYYLGLKPGKYIACIDTLQMSNLNFTADPQQIEFTIKKSEEGDIAGGIDFTLNENTTKAIPKIENIPPISISSIKKASTIFVSGNICTQPGKYYIQCGAFKNKNKALKLALFLTSTTDKSVGIILENGFFIVQVGCFPDKYEANKILEKLKEKRGYNDMFIKII